MIVLVAGKKNAGKDFVSEYLADKLAYLDFKKVAFANPLKEELCDLFNISIDTLNSLKNHEEILFIDDYYTQLNMRQILQNYGEMRKKDNKYVWVDKILNNRTGNIIVSDFRLKLEYDRSIYFDHQTITVKVLGGNTEDTHPTETELDDFEFDFIIDNRRKKIDKLFIEQTDNIIKYIKGNIE